MLSPNTYGHCPLKLLLKASQRRPESSALRMAGRAPAVPTARQHIIGIALVSLVAVIWVASAELIQFIFGESDFDRPLLLTYISTSLFTVYLLGFLHPSWRADLRALPGQAASAVAATDNIPMHDMSNLTGPVVGADVANNLTYTGASAANPSLRTDCSTSLFSLPLPGLVRASMQALSSGSFGGYIRVQDSSDSARSVNDVESESSFASLQQEKLNARQIFRVALVLAPLFFLSNWLFNLGLSWTSVASSSTISTLSTLFTLLLGVPMAVEKFTVAKLVSALLTIAGVALISRYDQKSGGTSSVAGDAVSVLAAFVYAAYTTMLKFRAGTEEKFNTAMMFGFLGAIVTLTAWPNIIILHLAGWEHFSLPSWHVAGLVMINALVGTVLSDYLWARAVVLTTPVIGTLALSLTVPLSVFVDYMFRELRLTAPYICGISLVVFGFIVANIDLALTRGKENAAADAERQEEGRPAG